MNMKDKELTCQLTSRELRRRKATVLAGLKQKILKKKELPNGFAFCFPGNDAVLDELIAFIKTERLCCDFFIFGLTIEGDKSEIWLKLTGEQDVKEFITHEIGF